MLNRKLMGPDPSVPSDRPGRPPGEIFLFAVTDISLSKFYFEHVLGAAALLFLPMAILLAKGIAPVFAVAGLAVLVLGLVRNRAVPLDLGPVISSLGALSVWALFTVLWSITPAETVKTSLSLTAIFFRRSHPFCRGQPP